MELNNTPREDSKVFISYSRKDISFAKSIVSHLIDHVGIVPWIDMSGIESGSQSFINELVKAIDSAEVIVFLLSHNSIQSPVAQQEVQYARNTGKRVCPVLIDTKECISGWFLFTFGVTNYIDYFNPREREKFFVDLRQWFGTSPNNPTAEIGMSQIEAEMMVAGLCIGATNHIPPENILDNYKSYLYLEPIDNWLAYYRIGHDLSKDCKDLEGGNEFAILAFSRSFECSFPEHQMNMKARAIIMRGAIKRRIEDYDGALQDTTIGLKIAKELDNAQYELEYAHYNLARIAIAKQDYRQCVTELSSVKALAPGFRYNSYIDSICRDYPELDLKDILPPLTTEQ